MLLSFNLSTLARRLADSWRSLPTARKLARRKSQLGTLEVLESRMLLTNFQVTSLGDDVNGGDGLTTLREALNAANGIAGADTISFAPNLTGKISLTGGELPISDTVTITGLGAAATIVDAQQASRVFNISGTAGDVTFDGLTIQGGKTTGNGRNYAGAGILNNSTGALTILNSTVQNNSTTGNSTSTYNNASGAAIFCLNTVTLTLTNSVVSGNFTNGTRAGGGAIYGYSGGSLTLNQSTITGNSTNADGGRGGAIYWWAGTVALNDTQVRYNKTAGANAPGGAIYSNSASVSLDNSNVFANQTLGNNSRGGGIYSRSGAVNLNNSYISGNQTFGADSDGGGIYSISGAVTLTRSSILSNGTAGDNSNGGGIAVLTGNLTLVNSRVSGNSTTGVHSEGGGILAGNTTTYINSSEISGNATYGNFGYGGGLRLGYGAATLVNSTVSGNFSTSTSAAGGGISSFQGTLSLTNCTVANNSSAATNFVGGGIFSSAAVTINNSIVAKNVCNVGSPDLAVGNLTVNNSLIGDSQGTGLTPSATPDGQGNLIGSHAAPIDPVLGPLQFNNGAYTQTHALLASPAINRGSNILANLPALAIKDQIGQPRFDGPAIDMGAFELQTPAAIFNAETSSISESVGTFQVTVNLSAVSPLAVTIPFSVGGTALNPTDYTIDASPLTIPAGQTSGVITVTVVNRAGFQPNRTVLLNFGTLTNAVAGATTSTTVTIQDTSAPPVVNFAATTQSVNEGVGIVQVTVNLSFAVGQNVTIPFTTSGTAGNPADYTIAASPLVIPAGQTSGTFNITVVDDSVIDAAETIVVTLGTPTNATLGASSVDTLTIVDNDAIPSATFSVAAQSVSEASTSLTLTVNLSLAPTANVSIPFSVTGGTATSADFTLSSSPLIIASGSTSGSITLNLVNDALIEGNETVIVTLGTPTNATLGAVTAQTVTITDNDVNHAPTFNAGQVFQIAENSGAGVNVGQVIASDSDTPAPFNTLTFSLSNNPGNLFVINSATGMIAVANGAVLDHETNPTVTLGVTVADGGTPSLSTVQNVTITITNVNETPTITSGAAVNVPENTSPVLTVTASDPDGGAQSLTFSIDPTSPDANKFSIVAATGVLSFVNAPNFESPTDSGRDNIYNVTVKVTDNGAPNLFTSQPIVVTVTNVNETPVFTSPAAANVPENSTATILNVAATDPDAGQTLTFSIDPASPDGSKFTITSAGALSLISAANFEATNDAGADRVYNVTVIATDSGAPSQATSQPIVVTLTNVNESPVFTSNAAANTAENTTAVLTVTASDPDGGAQTLSFSIDQSSPDASKFTINPATGVLTFTNAPNFELPSDSNGDNVYNVTVKATDTGVPSLSTSQPVVVTVTNVNEAPSFTSSAAVNVAENTTVVLTVVATDPDSGQTLTYSIDPASPDRDKFSINSSNGVLTFVNAPNFEAATDVGSNNIYNVIVRAADNGSPVQVSSQSISVTVTNANESPVITSNPTINVAENSTVAFLTVTATDPDTPTQVLSFSIDPASPDAGKFTINPATGALSFVTAPNFESPTDVQGDNVYNVTVKATDNGTPNQFTSQAISVTVTNVNEAPAITSSGSATVAENSTGTFLTVTAQDVDSPAQTLSFSIDPASPDAARFTINSATGALSFNSAPDFEAATDFNTDNVYNVTVRVTDNGVPNQTTSKAMTVTVTNVNEAPAITSAATANAVENSTATFLTVTATDPDSPAQTLTFSIDQTSPDAAKFTINSSTGALSFAAAPDFEAPDDFGKDNIYNVTVKATDSGTPNQSTSKAIAVTVTNVNEAPTITSGATANAVENSTAPFMTVTGTDLDTPAQTLSFSIDLASPDGAKFTINPSTGALSFAVAPDFEAATDSGADNVYNLTVKATDNGTPNQFTSKAIAVTVTNINEAPTITANQVFNIAENSAAGAAVGIVIAADPDKTAPLNSLSFSLSTNPNNVFAINATTGQITVAKQSALDFETTKVFTVGVTVRDGATPNLSAVQNVTINVTNVNEPPVVAAQTFVVPENSAGATVVGIVAASDPENSTRTFSIVSGSPNNPFTINSATGLISVNTPAPILDFETTPTITLQVRVTDSGNASTTQSITVSLANVNEAPVLGGGAGTSTFTKKQAPVSLMPNITVADSDAATDLIKVEVSYFIQKGGLITDVSFANPSSIGTLVTSGPTSFKKLGGTVTQTITLNAGVTVDEVRTFLRSFTFSTKKFDTASKNLGRHIDVTVFDQQNVSNKVVTQIRAKSK